jgi:PAS domain S-box-containing protein
LEAQVQERTAQLSVANEQLRQEVAERKQVEESLRESEARFRRLFESNIVGVIFADTSGRIADANDVFLQMIGYTREDLREGKVHWDELSPPEYRQLELRAIEQSKTTGIITPWEKEFFRNDGTRVPVLVGGVLLDEFNGQGIAFVLDISDRKRIEEALRESEQQFRQIFQEAPVGMTLSDFQTHQFIQVNPAYYQLLGYTPSEIMSLTFDELTHPDDLPENLHYMEQIERGKSDSFCMEKRYLKKNGELVWANLTVTVLRNQNGKPGFCLAMIEDITERKQAEEQLKTSLQEKETLLKEIHHRVKNNLQVISSLLRLQSRQIRDQQVLELFKDSQNRVQAMALIHELLYQSPNLAHIDFQKYIQTLVGNLCRSYNVHQRAITFKINVEQVSLAIDTAIPCGLIINELVSNSLKHGFPEHHGGEICLSFQHGDNGQFILSISDNGVGMGSDFDFRNTSSLGLQLVCRLTKQLEGSIELNRERGTEFKIAFATLK